MSRPVREMRYARTSALLLTTLLAAAPAFAGQAGGGIDLSQPLPGLAPAETGKPLLPPPNAELPTLGGDCVPALPCGARLLGAVRKYGAVEVQVPALRW